MNIAIATLFEKEYFKGVFALVNSLYHYNFEGTVFIGYPSKDKAMVETINWTFPINQKDKSNANNIVLKFYPIDTNGIHLTNYKPYFLKEIFSKENLVDALIYFDPDIVVNYHWSWYEMWIEQGLAVVHEIILNDMPSNHPVRKLWMHIIEDNQLGIVEHQLTSYCNAGFLGIKRTQISFLDKWIDILSIAVTSFGMSMKDFVIGGREKPFRALDQDAFNIALMCTNEQISEMGAEAMGFKNNGLQVMLHATGSPKPWNKNFLINAIKGIQPSAADKGFITYSNGILTNYSSGKLYLKKVALKCAILISRFYKKN